jgi:hypothetical protein
MSFAVLTVFAPRHVLCGRRIVPALGAVLHLGERLEVAGMPEPARGLGFLDTGAISLSLGPAKSVLFVAAMLAGMLIHWFATSLVGPVKEDHLLRRT